MKFIKSSLLLIILLNVYFAQAQSGGKGVYSFLRLSNSAYVSGLGGDIASVFSAKNLNVAYYNPSLLNDAMHKNAVISYVNYLAGINFGFASYSYNFDKLGNTAIGISYLDYGDFTEADASGNITGTFSAGDYALNLIWSHYIFDDINLGVNLKPVYSHLEKYTSFGIVTDLGLTWQPSNKNFSTSIVLRNFGWQIKPYHDGVREKIKPDLAIGFSQHLEHAPFTINLTLNNLLSGDISYDSYTQSNNTLSPYQDNKKKSGFDFQKTLGNAMKHVVVGVEFRPAKFFHAVVGYNHLRQRELSMEDISSFAGISWGFGINILKSRVTIAYSRAGYHKAGGSNHITISYRPHIGASN